MSRAKLTLFTPGPVKIPPIVAEYLADPPCNYHRQKAFQEMFAETERDLKTLVGMREPDAYYATMLVSTGTGAVEATLQALSHLGRGLVLDNGFFAQRWVDQCVQNGIAHTVLSSANDRPIDPATVDAALAADPSIKWVYFVSHETRAGLVNPMVELGRVAKKRGCLVGADIVSSAYAYPIDIEAAQLDLAVTSSAKAIMGVPGLGIVFTRVASVPALKAARKQGSYYLDVVAEFEKQRAEKQTRFAQPVALHAALHAACLHLTQVGIANHMARIQRQMRDLTQHLEGLGVTAYLDAKVRSNIAVNFKLPAGLEYPEFARLMEQEGYYLLYGIPGDMTMFQISTIGDLADEHVAGIQRAFTNVLGRRLRKTA